MTPFQIVLVACLFIVGSFNAMITHNRNKETTAQQLAKNNLETLKQAPVKEERRRGTLINEIV